MKKPLAILLGGLILGMAGFAVPYFNAASASRALQKSEQPGLEWLKSEFHLGDQEFQRILALHRGYEPECKRYCTLIAEKDAELQRLVQGTNKVTPEIDRVLQEKADLRRQCQANMLAHFYSVSQAMPPAEGKRYLDWVQKHTLDMGAAMNHSEPSTNVHALH